MRFRLLLCLHFLAVMAAVGCSGGNTAPQRKPPQAFPVEVETVTTRKADLVVHAVGSVVAFEILPVTTRVSGTVQAVRFREGEAVRAGEPLVDIELERYELALRSAEAAYEKAKATLREIETGLRRRVDIQGNNPGFVSPEELDSWQTRAQSARADSAQAAAALDLAKLNFRDAHVPAPTAGTIQSRVARTGQYMQIGATVATMVRRDPLLLRFSVPVQDATKLTRGLSVSFAVAGASDSLRATIMAVSESADPQTRMVEVTAEVTVESAAELQPGVFAEVTVLLGESNDLPVIPQVSIRPSERGFLGFVVEDTVAHERVLKLGLQTFDGRVEVQEGLRAGEQLVVRGAEALSQGARVRIVSAAKPAPGDSGSASR
ncbi:MAG: efflux RND transporter periplasmic adaptor subunit [bacterium]|nr:efflux RND transporter periplasmic adaptor subunit [bacterium]